MSGHVGALAVRRAGAADGPAWDAFVRALPEGDPLQTWAWGELNAPLGEVPLRLLVADAGGRLRGVAQALVRRAGLGRTVAYVPHGPLWDRDAADAGEVLAALFAGLRDAARETRAMLVIVDPRAVPGRAGEPGTVAAALAAHGLRPARHDLQARTTRIVELRDGGAEMQAAWHPDARRRVRRAAKEGVTTTLDRTGDPAAIGHFHDLLVATADRADFRVRPPAFLRGLAAASAAGDGWYLVLAWRDGRPIAGIACPRLGERGYYFYAASLRDEALGHAYGGYATLAALMAALHADGARELDLWGVAEEEAGDTDPSWRGFSQFKRKFDGRPLVHPGTFELVVDPAWYRLRALRERLTGRA